MQRKYYLVLLSLFLSLIGYQVTAFGATYKYYDDVIVSSNTTYGSNTYRIYDSKFQVSAGAVLKIAGSANIVADGDIIIYGKIETTSAELELRLTSLKGSVKIYNEINVHSAQGTTGSTGIPAQNGSPGGTGKRSSLYINAMQDVLVNGKITNIGGTGGTGGVGGRSNGWGEDGGNGGPGGVGGQGGLIHVIAQKGKVEIKNKINSIGGKGGTGGTGGPDKTVWGGPGNGGTGGTGGKGGEVIIAGQTIKFLTGSGFNLPAGTGGSGGAGGSSGSAWGSGDPGASGGTGGPGSVKVYAGEALLGTRQITDLSLISIIPSNTSKIFMYDNKKPNAPTEVKFDHYQDKNGVFYTNSAINAMQIKVPTDGGYDAEGITIMSGLSKFEIYSYEKYFPTKFSTSKVPVVSKLEPYNEGEVKNGFFPANISVGSSAHNQVIHLNVKVYDKNGNSTLWKSATSTSTWLKLYVDTVKPAVPTNVTYSNNGDRSIRFDWTAPQDQSGIKGYDILVNGKRVNDITNTYYIYNGDYNEKVTFKVLARDNAGNESDFSSVCTAYTYAREAQIKEMPTTGGGASNYYADLMIQSVGLDASGYRIKYYEVDAGGNSIGSAQIKDVGNQTIVTLNNLGAHKYYKFAVQTYNSNSPRDYTSWSTYGKVIQVRNNKPTIASLHSPDLDYIVNLQNVSDFLLKANVSTDLDANDSLEYIFVINGKEYRDNISFVGDYVTFAPPLVDGTYEWYVRTYDKYDYTSGELPRSYSIDLTKPNSPEFTVSKIFVGIDRQIQLNLISVLDSDVTNLIIGSAGKSDTWVNKNQMVGVSYAYQLADQEGDQAIYLKVVDDAGNLSDRYEVRVIYDKTAPDRPSTVTLTGGIRSIDVDWNDCQDQPLKPGASVSGVQKYQVRYRKVGTDDWIYKYVESGSKYTFNKVGENQSIDDNEHYEVQIKTYDNAGNESEWTSSAFGYSKPSVGSLSVTKDSFNYELSADGTYQHYVDININAGKAAAYQVIRHNRQNLAEKDVESPWIPVTSSQSTYKSYVSSHGEYEYQIVTRNPNGETRASTWTPVDVPNHLPEAPVNSVSGFVNLVRPDFVTNPAHDVDGDGLFYYFYIEEVDRTGVRNPIVEWELANDSTTVYHPTLDLTDGHTYYYKVGVVEEQSKASFEQGNGEPQVVSLETNLILDLAPPKTEVTLPESIRQKVEAGEFLTSASAVITASDVNETIPGGSCSGLDNIYVYWNGDSTSKTKIASGTTITPGHGIHTLYVIGTDKIGNQSDPKTVTFKIDETGPVISNLDIQSTNVAGVEYVGNASELFISFDMREDETNISNAQYAVVSTNEAKNLQLLSDSRWQTISLLDGVDHHYEIPVSTQMINGEGYQVVVKAENSLGLETMVESKLVVVDSFAPSIRFSNTSGSEIPKKYRLTSLAQLTLECTVSDDGAGVQTEEYGLVEGLDENLVTTWHSEITQLVNEPVVDGHEYYVVVRAKDKLGAENIDFSVPILIDGTGPNFLSLVGGDVIPGTDQYQTQWDPTYLKVSWKVSDEVNLTQMRYAIGTTSGGKEISTQLEGNIDGWFNIEDWSHEKTLYIQDLNLSSGSYYVTLEAMNEVGLITEQTISSPISVDTSLPVTPVVTDDGIYTQLKELHFSVAFPNEELQNQQYYYQIVDGDGKVLYGPQELFNPNQLPNVSVSVNEADGFAISLGSNYFVLVGDIKNDEFLAQALSDGIVIDWTDPEFESFDDGEYFTDKNVYLTWSARDAESGIDGYWIQIGTTRGGGELTNGWVELGNKTSVAIQDLGFEDQGLYFATIKARNGSGREVEITRDGFRIDNVAPPKPKVLTEGNYTNQLDTLSASWTWTDADPGSGTKEYYYDLLTVRDPHLANWKPVKDVTGDHLSTKITLTNLHLVNGTTYYIAVKAVDHVGLESIGISEGIMADVNAPTTPIVDDLRDYQDFTDQITAQFISRDEESGLSGFKYAIGTLDNEISEVTWREITQTEETALNLDLQEGQVYFVSAIAYDNSGLRSAKSRSDGITIDSQRPSIDFVSAEGMYTDNASELFFVWESTISKAPIVAYEYMLSKTAVPATENWKTTTQKQILLTAMEEIQAPTFENTTYYFTVRARDASNKVSEPLSTHIQIDATPPTQPMITNNGDYQSKELHLSWRSSDGETGLARYRYALGTTRGERDVTDGWVIVEETDELIHVYRNDLSLQHNHRYYLSVQAQNNAGKWSEIGYDDGFLVDLNPPTEPVVVGPGAYLTSEIAIPDIYFSSEEGEVRIKAYRYDILLETEAGGLTELTTEEILVSQVDDEYPKNVSITFDVDELYLIEGEKYHIAVQTQNTLNMWSQVGITSVPFLVDVTSPTVTFVEQSKEIVTNGETIQIGWETDEVGTAYYRLEDPNGQFVPSSGYNKIEVTSIGDVKWIQFAETNAGNYTLHLYMEDAAGNFKDPIYQDIRVNAKPTIQVGLPLSIYKGRELILTSTDFSVNDSDGTIINYQWDFGDETVPESSSTFAIPHTYQEVGGYFITLTVTDNDGGTATERLEITVGNTLEGSLHLDEIWSGTMNLKGDVIIPVGKILTLQPGTVVVVPKGSQFVVHGTLDSTGGFEGIRFTTIDPTGIYGPNLWKGIYFSESSQSSQFVNTTVEYAERGLVLNQQMIQIQNSTFRENGIGIHMAGITQTVISDNQFENNLYYGIKEEGTCDLLVMNNMFVGNGIAPYYHNQKTLLTVDEINHWLGYGNE